MNEFNPVRVYQTEQSVIRHENLCPMTVHLSMVEPLPHQISAVYAEMLPRQPLRFLLADDLVPGLSKVVG
jgi:hypothetical protein